LAYQKSFKIIDKNTLMESDLQPLHYMDKWQQQNFSKKFMEEPKKKARFVAVTTLPEPISWIKYKKEFWCNGEEYNNWINSHPKY
jgi:hypothetical protein